MTTAFSSLPIVDLSDLSEPSLTPNGLLRLSEEICGAFSTTGFAYLLNAPLTYSHEDVFALARKFFEMDEEKKMSLATKIANPANHNTYRGYFPPQPGRQDNLKEGFELGPAHNPRRMHLSDRQKFDLCESNVWPQDELFPGGRVGLEQLHAQLQVLSSTLLSLIAVGLGKPADYFSAYLTDSLSTLRLLHYPPQPPAEGDKDNVKLCCTPHTDSGILTLLHQDQTGGLEVRNSDGKWVAAPYVPGSIVVNIGDLMSQVR